MFWSYKFSRCILNSWKLACLSVKFWMEALRQLTPHVKGAVMLLSEALEPGNVRYWFWIYVPLCSCSSKQIQGWACGAEVSHTCMAILQVSVWRNSLKRTRGVRNTSQSLVGAMKCKRQIEMLTGCSKWLSRTLHSMLSASVAATKKDPRHQRTPWYTTQYYSITIRRSLAPAGHVQSDWLIMMNPCPRGKLNRVAIWFFYRWPLLRADSAVNAEIKVAILHSMCVCVANWPWANTLQMLSPVTMMWIKIQKQTPPSPNNIKQVEMHVQIVHFTTRKD